MRIIDFLREHYGPANWVYCPEYRPRAPWYTTNRTTILVAEKCKGGHLHVYEVPSLRRKQVGQHDLKDVRTGHVV